MYEECTNMSTPGSSFFSNSCTKSFTRNVDKAQGPGKMRKRSLIGGPAGLEGGEKRFGLVLKRARRSDEMDAEVRCGVPAG